ncbi:MAG: tetratricopeptide repeat protein, partial [Promethearchaeota archaeon]
SIEDIDKLPIDEQYRFYLLKSNLFYLLGQYKDSLDVSEILIHKCMQFGNELICFDAFLIEGKTLLWLGKYKECLKTLLKCEEILSVIEDQPDTLIGNKRQKLAYIWANYYWELGNFNKLFEYSELNLDLCKKYGTPHDNARAYLYMGLSYGEVGKLDKAIANYEKCLDISIKLNDKQSKHDIGSAYNNIGENYRFKGELDKGLEYYNKCLMIGEETEEKSSMAIALHNIALVYCEKGQLDISLSNFKKSLQLEREIGNNFEISRTLFDIIVNHLDQINLETTQNYLEEIKEINKKENSSRINFRYRIAKALILKKTGINRNIIKAESILNELLEENSVENELLVIILLNLCEILFREIQTSKEQEILGEISSLIDKLIDIAKKERSFSLLAETHFFKAKLELINLNILETQKILTKSRNTAKKYNLTRLEKKLSMEHDHLLDNLDTWDKLKEKNATLSERLTYVSFEGDLQLMMKKKEIEQIKIIPEEPQLLSIISKSGISLFTYYFEKEWKNKNLFSSFMSAFNSFSKEFFSETIDRVKIGDNTIIMVPCNQKIVCYVIKGQSYPAQKKLTKFLEKIMNSEEIQRAIDNAINHGEILNFKNTPVLKKVVDSIFV